MRARKALRLSPILALIAFMLACVSAACSPPRSFDPSRSLGYLNASAAEPALAAAKRDAIAANKRILIIAGGEWCRWCHVLERFLHETPDIDAQWRASFVVLKFAVGENGEGNSVLNTLPAASGYPHFWVLAADGTLIASVETGALEHGNDDYNPRAVRQFQKNYGPPAGR